MKQTDYINYCHYMYVICISCVI